jgi:Flp pilus assembly protein TadG
VAVEFAIVALTLVLLLLGVVQFGWFLWYQSTLQDAVEATARYCSINPSCNAQTTGTSYLLGINAFVSPTFTLTQGTTASCATASGAQGTQVNGTFTFASLLPGYVPNLTVTSQSCYTNTP